MTTKAAFTEQEWDLISAAPPAAGMIVSFASKGGMIRETFEMGKVYVDARKQHGESELLDELVSSKPERDHTKHHSTEELKEHSLQLLGQAVVLLESKATSDEVEDYKRFVLTLAERVAQRHEEDDVQVSAEEQQAIDAIRVALGD